MNKNILIVGVILVVVAAVIYFFNAQSIPNIQQPETSGTMVDTGTQSSPATNNAETTVPKIVTVTYTNAGFSPKTVTINKADTVIFIAGAGSDSMWVASDPHPAHPKYDGTTRAEHCAVGYSGSAPFDQCSAGATFSFAFGKSGTWEYHNHKNPNDGGMVIVQ